MSIEYLNICSLKKYSIRNIHFSSTYNPYVAIDILYLNVGSFLFEQILLFCI